MQVLVMGGGVIGITSAYYLQQQGFAVTLLESNNELATGASFANAGQLSADYATPWAAPGIPLQAIKWLFQADAPLAISLTADWRQYQWLWQALRNCNSRSYQLNKERMLALARYSRQCMAELCRNTELEFSWRQQGLTQLFRSRRQLRQARRDLQVLEQAAIEHRLLQGEQLLEVEPALAGSMHLLAGGLHLPADQTGDCHQFCQQLAQLFIRAGGKIRLATRARDFAVTGDRVAGVYTDAELLRADHYVMAAGYNSVDLLRQLGIRVPVYPLKGYSLTYAILDAAAAPASTVLDESYKIAITRLGNRIRLGGMAELRGADSSLPQQRRRTLQLVADDLYPHAGDSSAAQFWSGLRPSTPDSVPIVGRSSYANLWLNIGHGTLGWTMACGSAQYLTDLIADRPAAFAASGLDMFRYR